MDDGRKNEKKAFKNKVITFLLLLTMAFSIGNGYVVADENLRLHEIEEVKAGDKFLSANGQLELVVRVNKDGSFISEEYNPNSIRTRVVKCSHPAASLKAVAELNPEFKDVATASCCYKYRSVTQCRCKKCGALIKMHGPWKSVSKHSFPLFGKTCKRCEYKK